MELKIEKKRKTRQVAFRLTDREYRQLKMFYPDHTISEICRSSIQYVLQVKGLLPMKKSKTSQESVDH